MRQFFKHFGSKARIAPKLPHPMHKRIIEPFAGSAAFSVYHATVSHDVLLIDSDERVCLVWDFLINSSRQDILDLPVQHFLDGGDIRELNLSRERYLFIQRWLSISGTHSHKLAPCLLADRGGEAGNTWCFRTRQRIAEQIDQINHWKIIQGQYHEAPDVEAHWHIDSPYQHNKHGFSEYKCQPPDYEHLGIWCRSRRGHVTVHEQHGANWLPFETLDLNHRTNRTVNGEAVTAHEVYWTNDTRGKDGTMAFDFGGAPCQ